MTKTSQIIDNKFYLGERELTIIMKDIIRTYRFHNHNKDPEAIIIPRVEEVSGVKVEYETGGRDTKPKASEPSNSGS